MAQQDLSGQGGMPRDREMAVKDGLPSPVQSGVVGSV